MIEQNVTSYTGDFLIQISNILSIILVISVIAVVGFMIIKLFRKPINDSEYSDEEEIVPIKKIIPPHKQTYEEFVKERLKAEELLRNS